ncbi:McrC family protein [Cetobacterium ceti]
MNKAIIVRENHDWINIGNGSTELTEKEFLSLKNYIEFHLKKKKILEFSLKKFRFYNYVGFIQIENILIEVYPKTSPLENLEDDKRNFLNILYKSKELHLNLLSNFQSQVSSLGFYELLIRKYIILLKEKLQGGLFKDFEKIEKNSNTLKGKILLEKHLKLNLHNSSKIYCEQTSLEYNNIINIIIKKTLEILFKNIKNYKLKKDILYLLNFFQKVDTKIFNLNLLSKPIFNRKTLPWKEIFILSKAIIEKNDYSYENGNKKAFSMIFYMPKIYEKYIFYLLKNSINIKNMDIIYQDNSQKLLINQETGKEHITLKPDFIILNKNIPYSIVDAKWKSSYSQNDIYQIYTYLSKYKNVKEGILIFPKFSEEDKDIFWNVNINNISKNITIKYINIQDFEHEILSLKVLF